MGKTPDKSRKYYHPPERLEALKFPCKCVIRPKNTVNCRKCGAMVCKEHGCPVC